MLKRRRNYMTTVNAAKDREVKRGRAIICKNNIAVLGAKKLCRIIPSFSDRKRRRQSRFVPASAGICGIFQSLQNSVFYAVRRITARRRVIKIYSFHRLNIVYCPSNKNAKIYGERYVILLYCF